jgi:DNA-binding beta-propeller fold protein YncE
MNFRKDVFLVLGVTVSALLTMIFSTILHTANADSTMATITVGPGPYGAVFNPDKGYIYTVSGKTDQVHNY